MPNGGPSYSAVLLAGGKSTRMGRDKALLPVPDSDRLLWQWQWRTLEELHPGEIFWSGSPRPGLPESVRMISDTVANAGPLAGIGACLDAMKSDLLVVLAIDLPRMTSIFLQGLLNRCSSSCGIVAQHGDYFEPLAAVYPQALAALAAKHLQQKRYALQDLIREAVRQDLIRTFSLPMQDAHLFKNLNFPADIEDNGTTLS